MTRFFVSLRPALETRLRPWRNTGQPARGRSSLAYALRLAAAAAGAFAVGSVLLPGKTPVLAALTATLVVAVTVVDVVANSVKRVISVVLGVLLAIGAAELMGLTWWSLAAVVTVAVLIGQALRLGDHVLEIPISAMLVFTVGGSEITAVDRILQTVVGAAVGLLVSVVAPPQVQQRGAAAAVARLAGDLSLLVDRAAAGLVNGVTAPEARRWLAAARTLTHTAVALDEQVNQADRSRRLNPRALGHRDTSATLRGALDALEHSTVALRSVFRSVLDAVEADPDVLSARSGSGSMRPAVLRLLTDTAGALSAFGSLLRAEAEGGSTEREQLLRQALRRLRQSRADVHRLADRTEPWGTRPLVDAVVEGVDRVMAELDADQLARVRTRRRLLDPATMPLRPTPVLRAFGAPDSDQSTERATARLTADTMARNDARVMDESIPTPQSTSDPIAHSR